MSDDIKKILEQFNRIDAEMGGKNIPVNDEASRLKSYRNIVEGRFASITEKKRLAAQESQWSGKFGFMRSLDEGKKEKIGDESEVSENHIDDYEPTDEFVGGDDDIEECDETIEEDRLADFRATAINDQGMTFGFEFKYPNWNGVQEHAQKILDATVAADPLHQKHGPWRATKIDIGYL